MSSFEDEIMARAADAIANQQSVNASQEEERRRTASEIASIEAEKRDLAQQAREIGLRAVRLLVDAGRPTIPVWDDIEYGERITGYQSGLSGARKISFRHKTLDVVGQGWHILTSECMGDYDNPPSKSHYALTVDGVYGSFDRTTLPNFHDRRDGKIKKIKGIIRLEEERYEGPRLRTIDSDRFKNAIAYHLATGRVFKERHPGG